MNKSIKEKIKKIVIIGGGNLGGCLVKLFRKHKSGYSIKIIEKNEITAKNLSEEVKNEEIILGDALEEQIINEAEIENSDLLIGATKSDAVNLISSFISKKVGCKHVISLIEGNSYENILRSLGIDLIFNPTGIITEKIIEYIKGKNCKNVSLFADGKYLAMEVKVRYKKEKHSGMEVKAFESKTNCEILFIKRRQGSTQLDEKEGIKEGDKLLIWTTLFNIPNIKKIITFD